MIQNKQYIVVLGCYRSGSSCLCGVLQQLGVSFGPCARANLQNPKGFFEHKLIRGRIIQAFDQAKGKCRVTNVELLEILSAWKSSVALLPSHLVGLKHPLLSLMGNVLSEAFLNCNVQYVSITRSHKEMVTSIQRCAWQWTRSSDLDKVVETLCNSRDQFLATIPHVTVDFHQLLTQPKTTVTTLVQQLGLTPSNEQLLRAIAFVEPELSKHSSSHPSNLQNCRLSPSNSPNLPTSETKLFQKDLLEKNSQYKVPVNDKIELTADDVGGIAVKEYGYPPVHPNVRSFFGQSSSPLGPLFLPVLFDVKQAEAFRTQFLVKGKSSVVYEHNSSTIPVFFVSSRNERRACVEELFCRLTPAVSIFIDLHDHGKDCIDFTDAMWTTVRDKKVQVIYVKLQVGAPSFYSDSNQLPAQLHVISVPLLLGGSRFHITNADDYDGENLFRKIFVDHQRREYENDWCWIGANTSRDRRQAVDILSKYVNKSGVMKVAAPSHRDANFATISYQDYLRYSQSSRVNLSLNGNGVWCLKDGELFSRDCFIVRQYHPTLTVCPLSPKNGEHWVITPTQGLTTAIEYYLQNETERESIRMRGHELMRQVLFEDLWSKYYVERIEKFLSTKLKSAWGDLLIS